MVDQKVIPHRPIGGDHVGPRQVISRYPCEQSQGFFPHRAHEPGAVANVEKLDIAIGAHHIMVGPRSVDVREQTHDAFFEAWIRHPGVDLGIQPGRLGFKSIQLGFGRPAPDEIQAEPRGETTDLHSGRQLHRSLRRFHLRRFATQEEGEDHHGLPE